MKSSGILLCSFLCLSLAAETRGSLRVETEKFGNEDTSSILIINTDIPKTEVYLNGRYKGYTPYREKRIAPGFWRIGLKNDGYYPESFIVQVEPGEQKKVYVELLPKPQAGAESGTDSADGGNDGDNGDTGPVSPEKPESGPNGD
jgi:hypothetical protein